MADFLSLAGRRTCGPPHRGTSRRDPPSFWGLERATRALGFAFLNLAQAQSAMRNPAPKKGEPKRVLIGWLGEFGYCKPKFRFFHRTGSQESPPREDYGRGRVPKAGGGWACASVIPANPFRQKSQKPQKAGFWGFWGFWETIYRQESLGARIRWGVPRCLPFAPP